jgi:hypothetical protein
MRNGKGVEYYKDGAGYDGDWVDDRKHGFGIAYLKDDFKTYEGEWSKGKKNGKGIEYLTDGTKYEGDWSNGIKTGIGVFHFSDDSNKLKYEG